MAGSVVTAKNIIYAAQPIAGTCGTAGVRYNSQHDYRGHHLFMSVTWLKYSFLCTGYRQMGFITVGGAVLIGEKR